jgi:methylaspartate mutase epsilon subunit
LLSYQAGNPFIFIPRIRGHQMEPKLRQKRIDEDQFLEMRKLVLSLWPTGKEVDLDEAVEYQKALPDSKRFGKVVERLHREGRTVVFPRGGTPILSDQISLCRTLAEAGIELIPVTTDSYTRMLELRRAQDALEESISSGKALLNGYPLINHGVKNTRKLIESVPHGAFNPRISRLSYPLGSEIAFASGMTGIAASPFITFGAIEKNCTLEDSIFTIQYVHRLIGYYADRGIIITADNHGWIPTSVFPVSVNIATTIADALMCAEQGVKSIIPMIHMMGNLTQDLASISVSPRLIREYLDRFGYKDVVLPGTFVSQTPLYPMPHNMGGAFAFLNYAALVAALGKVESVFVRTIDESAGIPTEESHAVSYASANWMLNVIRGQNLELTIEGMQEEEEIAEMEIRAIIDRILELGEGDVIIGSIKAVNTGILDSSFSPNKNVKDKVLGVKDRYGAVRYSEFGKLPIPKEAKEFHRQKVADRAKAEGRKMDHLVTIEDLWAFGKGKLTGVING